MKPKKRKRIVTMTKSAEGPFICPKAKRCKRRFENPYKYHCHVHEKLGGCEHVTLEYGCPKCIPVPKAKKKEKKS